MQKKVVFFAKCCLGALPAILLVLYTYICPGYFLVGNYPKWRQQKDFITSDTAPDYSILVLGDSKAESTFDPSQISDNMVNLAIPGGSISTMFYSMQTYLQHHAAPETVFMSFSPFNYTSLNIWNLTIYYNYLTFQQEMDLFRTARLLEDKAVAPEGYLSDWLSCRLRLPNKYVTALLNSGFNGRRESNAKVYDAKWKAQGHTYYGKADFIDKPFDEAGFNKFTVSDFERHYLYRLFDLLLEQDVHIILEQPPVNEATFDAFSDEYKQSRTACFAQIQEDYPDIEVRIEPLGFSNNCFGDNSHVNERGAKMYSAYIREQYSKLLA